MKKSNSGITLVALIITIVVLLILAVVSIGAVQNSGIIGYTQNAASEYEKGKEIDKNELSDMESLVKENISDINTLVYGVPEEFVIIKDNTAIYYIDGKGKTTYEILRIEENNGQYEILDTNGVNYEKFIIVNNAGVEVPMAAIANFGNHIYAMIKYNSDFTGFGFSELYLEKNEYKAVMKNIFEEEPKTRIYGRENSEGYSSTKEYYIIRPDGTIRNIYVSTADKIIRDEIINAQLEEFYEIILEDVKSAGVYRYVFKENDTQITLSVTATGEELIRVNGLSASMVIYRDYFDLREDITEADIDNMYPREIE